MHSARLHFRTAVGGTAVVVTTCAALAVAITPVSAAPGCGLPATGELSVRQIPVGLSAVECGLVGRVVTEGGVGVTIPEPGTAVGVEALRADGRPAGLQVEVAPDGRISFPVGAESTSSVAAASSPSACSDDAYSTNDLKEYGTYDWYIGDGGMPAGLSRSDAQAAFAASIQNITRSDNNCGYSDTVDASASYQGTTTYESDMSSSGTCTDRDEKSTWDAGDLDWGTVAQACWWAVPMPGMKNDLLEADVRFNTNDYNFTDNPGAASCNNQYDVRSVGTHEAGHVFGMGHVGSGHSELTMYTDSFTCTAKARSLGKGDVLGLRSIY